MSLSFMIEQPCKKFCHSAVGMFVGRKPHWVILDRPSGLGDRRIAIAAIDLFLPVVSHVFGTAQLGGRVGVRQRRLAP